MAKEIELRAELSSEQFSQLLDEMRSAPDLKTQNRCFVDYSTFLEGIGERKLDVRIRITDSKPEIIVKRGLFGGKVREEAQIKLDLREFDNALSVMALLGYTKGVAGGRRITRATLGPLEIALQEVRNFFKPDEVPERFVEVEFVGRDPNQSESDAIAQIEAFLEARGITPFEPESWNAYVHSLNQSYNGVYEHGVTSPDILRALGD